MICPNCGMNLDDDAKFCTGCGQKIEQTGPVCAGCGKPLKPNSKFCTSCGLPVGAPSNSTAAPQKTVSQSIPQKVSQNTAQKKDSSKLIMGIIIVILAIAVIAILAVFVILPSLKGNDSGDSNHTQSSNTEIAEATTADTATSETAVTTEVPSTAAASSVTTEAAISEVTEDASVTDEISPDDYLIANSSAEEIDTSDYSDFSWKDLCYAKNEIYARHGYIFKSTELQEYFDSQPWYKKNKKYTQNPTLSDVELKNVETLRQAELDAGNGSLYPLDGKDQN